MCSFPMSLIRIVRQYKWRWLSEGNALILLDCHYVFLNISLRATNLTLVKGLRIWASVIVTQGLGSFTQLILIKGLFLFGIAFCGVFPVDNKFDNLGHFSSALILVWLGWKGQTLIWGGTVSSISVKFENQSCCFHKWTETQSRRLLNQQNTDLC